MQPREWPRVIRIVQMVLNHTPSPVLDGVAPITVMTGHKAMGPSDHEAIPGPVEMATLDEIQSSQRAHKVKSQRALKEIHKRSSGVNTYIRGAAPSDHAKTKGTSMAPFDIGDFVLHSDAWQHTH
ncbi:hypothetical protein PHMEG_00023556 [Phytophthora megakarya]|uniref:Uncharacterized protein n=1 Tax=Phytophthora megakarya TaxID=4795 RepID=A0A225VHD7_9STRA|nr:hypothetical protein PHMEG_00023556 [Phytophthora megakarya]